MTPEQIEVALTVGDWILFAGLPASLYFTVMYAIRSPWWQSIVGVSQFILGASLVLLQSVVMLSLILGPTYEGRWLVRIIGYGALTVALYYHAFVYEMERRSPDPVLPITPSAFWRKVRARLTNKR